MKRFLIVVILSLFFVHCDHQPTYVGVYDFANRSWEIGQNIVFDFHTLTSRNSGELRLSLRYLPSAVGQRVRLAVRTTNADNVFFVDTVNLTLNRGAGDHLRSQEFIVRQSILWPKRSAHHTTITALSDLHNVASLTLTIDNAIQ